MNELPTIPERVEKGICWLEEQGAYDWAEKIVAAVDAAEADPSTIGFMMCGASTCAVGLALGGFGEFYKRRPKGCPVAEADRHGFYIDTAGLRSAAEVNAAYAPLEAEWLRKAREHAAYRAEVLG